MGKVRFEITDDKFQGRLSASYELSILFGMDSFTYMVTNIDHKILVLKDYSYQDNPRRPSDLEHQLNAILNKDSYVKQAHKRTRIVFPDARAALIPDRLYNRNQKESYLQQLTQLEHDHRVEVDDLDQFQARNVYAVPTAILELTSQYFPAAQSYHLSSALLTGLHKLERPANDLSVNLHVRSNQLYIFVFEGKNLQFFNSFPCMAAKDFVYYTLMVCDQFQLNVEQVPVYLSGQVLEDSDVYRLIFRYIKNLSFIDPNSDFGFGSNWGAYPKYFYLDLMSLIYCK